MSLSSRTLRFGIPLLVFLVIAVFLGVGLTLNPRELPSSLIDKPAPAFKLNLLEQPDLAFTPSDLQGQRWLLNVWASWCVGCRVEHPLLNQLALNTDIPMVGLNYKDNPDNARRWLAERGNPYSKIPMDIEGDAGIDWGVYGVPETFVIDENGFIIFKHTGPLDVRAVEQEILPLFSLSTTP
ncbi:MAG: DsbE family thiol:disulfide interchange protein [Gammaproteobacteria bacterium]|nr:DsbE family thiol:disulfide interchange protein [Gammaproteobacteria bacterium]